MLKSDLLSDEKYAFYKKDIILMIFCTCFSTLRMFPPTFIRKPFTHLSNTLDTLSRYKIPSINHKTVRYRNIDDSNAIHSLTKM